MSAKTVGRYAVLRDLGPSAAGTRFLAQDLAASREVVVQTVSWFADLDAKEREAAVAIWLERARALRALTHPRIVIVFDAGVSDGVPFLVKQPVTGPTLDTFCAQGLRLDPRVVVEMAARAAEALAYAHSRSVVHGAITPASIVRVGQVEVQVDGFGLAPPPGRLGPEDPRYGGGCPSPEQIRGAVPDARSDVFLLGCAAYELLVGRKPFAGGSTASVLYRVVHDDPPDPRGLGVAPALADVLRTALAKRPEDRFDSCASLASALRAAGADAGSSAEASATAVPLEQTPGAGLPPRRGSKRPQVRVLVGAGLVLALLCFAGARSLLRWWNEPVWLETRVRTEPPGLEVLRDGVALAPTTSGLVRFASAAPFAVLSATLACRTAEHRLSPADASGEVVLSVDPVELTWRFDPGVAGAELQLDGASASRAPVTLTLDLCQAHRVDQRAPGHHSVGADIPQGATPEQARSALDALRLAPIPKGRLELPGGTPVLAYWVDGRRVGALGRSIELEEGQHRVRFVSEEYWIDGQAVVRITGGEVVNGAIAPPPLGRLTVQAFPSNCRVFLRRKGGTWRFLDETPASRQIASGDYEVKVERLPAGEIQTRRVRVSVGDNPPERFSFESGR